MRPKLLVMAFATTVCLLTTAGFNRAEADPGGWWGPVIGDFEAGVIIGGVFRPYVYPQYDPQNSGSEFGPSYYGGTRNRYPPVPPPQKYKPNSPYKHWTEF